MIKLYKNLGKKEIFTILAIILLTVFQVYLTMTIIDFVQGIIKAITYLNYHNNPASLGVEFEFLVNNYGWEKLQSLEFCSSLGITGEFATTVQKIALASTKDIYYNGLMMILLAFLIMVVQAIISFFASYVCTKLASITREKVYKKVQNFSLGDIGKFSTASLITRSTNDIQQVQMASLMMMRMVFAAPITAIWALVKIRVASFELTIATMVAIVVLILIVSLVVGLALPRYKIVQKLTDDINKITRENLQGIRVVRAFNGENHTEEKFRNVNEKFTKNQIFVGRVMAVLSPSMSLIMSGLTLSIYWIGAHLINAGTIDYAVVTSFMMLSTQIIMSFVMLLLMFVYYPRAKVSAKRINEVLDEDFKIVYPKTDTNLTKKGTIEFKNVSFAYQKNAKNVLSNASFCVDFGQTLAIVGATASGKTTIVNLMLRIFDASNGEVLIDGENIKNITEETLNKIIAYVPQTAFLFRGSVKDNITMWKNYSFSSLENACKISESSEFINEKEEKFDYQISQGGKNVSGGQRQRLCIARAIIKDPEIYIFDDSFSALDYKTDKKVRENLKNMQNVATKVIVAQRIGTIMDADKIIVLDEGNIVGIGTHSELLKSCKLYKEIALSQLSKEELGLED